MNGFAVIRHTETGGIGTSPAEAMELHLANGWVRVSEYAPHPWTFNLPDFADAPDLDAIALEDAADVRDARLALAEGGDPIPLDDFLERYPAPDFEPAPDAKATTNEPEE